MNTHIKYDLIIVGAGLVGSSLALALKNSDFKILCLDRKPLALENEPAKSSRPISLSYTSVSILKNLGVWTQLETVATPILQVKISTQGGLGRLEFKASDYHLPALGYVVPFAYLEHALLQGAFHNAHLAYLDIQQIVSLNCSEEASCLNVMSGTGLHQLETQLVAAADGTHSQVRSLLNIETEKENAQEVALSARLHLEKPHTAVAYERFTVHGTFALLPAFDPKMINLVWTMPASEWELWRHKTNSELLRQVQTVFGYRLGKMLKLEVMAEYSLVSLLAKTQVHPGAVLIGNAAHSFYPLAAQGFNLGLRDAIVLAETLLEAKQKNRSLSSMQLLDTYRERRQSDQQNVQALIKSLHEIFALKIPGVNTLRAAALLGIDIATPLKNKLAKQCLGFSSNAPRLIREVYDCN